MTDPNASWLPFRQIDAFTSSVGKGNAAGIITLTTPLSDQQMQVLAREVNLSETAFLLPDPTGEADARIRYFTPTREIPFCGHATVASLHHLHDIWDATGSPFHGVRIREDAFVLSSRVGILDGHFEDGIAWTTTDPTVITGPWDGAWGDLLHGLGLDKDDLADDAEAIATGDGVVAVGVRDVKTLDALRPDQAVLGGLAGHGVLILAAWSRRGRAYGTDWHQRVFAPHYGIPEDPVTGAVSARLANILLAAGHLRSMEGDALPAAGPIDLKVRQGDAVGRRGIVKVRLDRDEAGDVTTTTIGGRAVTSVEGLIRVPVDTGRRE